MIPSKTFGFSLSCMDQLLITCLRISLDGWGQGAHSHAVSNESFLSEPFSLVGHFSFQCAEINPLVAFHIWFPLSSKKKKNLMSLALKYFSNFSLSQ